MDVGGDSSMTGGVPAQPAAAWRFGILHRESNNFVAECQTREEVEAELSNWQDCEIVDFDEVFKDV